MFVESIELLNYRNYHQLHIDLHQGTNVFYGDNAQGKTNILESVYVCSTTKSHRGSKDRELIQFGEEESHIKMVVKKDGIPCRIDMHLKKNKAKGVAVNGIPIKKASELFGIVNVIFFSPEDLNLIKSGPAERRRFLDLELCQINRLYVHSLLQYFEFLEELNPVIRTIHFHLSGKKEELSVLYEPNVTAEEFEETLNRSRPQELRQKMTLTGPHRDDLNFMVNGTDIRKYGSQGQQRTAALSLKLAEIELVKKIIRDEPVLLLDDVLSELDGKRQEHLLSEISNIQTLITCTGLDEFVNHRFPVDQIFKVTDGKVINEKQQ